jgi:hypothetical protein
LEGLASGQLATANSSLGTGNGTLAGEHVGETKTMKVSPRTIRALACFVTGENRFSIPNIIPPFRYRSASEIAAFFDDIGEKVLPGFRYDSVFNTLQQMNEGSASDASLPSDALRKVIEYLSHRNHFQPPNSSEDAVSRINQELADDGLMLVYDWSMVAPQLVSVGTPYTPGTEMVLTVPFPRTEPAKPVLLLPRFHRRPAAANPRLGFVLMPLASDFNDVYEESIRVAVEANDLDCQRADEIQGNDEIMEDVWEAIWKCRITVADLTDDNANVFYEVGIADTLGKEVVLIAQHGRVGRPPFDVSARRIVFYDNDNAGRTKLLGELKAMIETVLQK